METVINGVVVSVLTLSLARFWKRVTETVNHEQTARCGKLVIAAYLGAAVYYLMSLVIVTAGAWWIVKGLFLSFTPCLIVGGLQVALGVTGLFQSLSILRKDPQPIIWAEVFKQLKAGLQHYFSSQPRQPQVRS